MERDLTRKSILVNERNAYRVLVWKHARKIPLGKRKRRCKGSIKWTYKKK